MAYLRATPVGSSQVVRAKASSNTFRSVAEDQCSTSTGKTLGNREKNSMRSRRPARYIRPNRKEITDLARRPSRHIVARAFALNRDHSKADYLRRYFQSRSKFSGRFAWRFRFSRKRSNAMHFNHSQAALIGVSLTLFLWSMLGVCSPLKAQQPPSPSRYDGVWSPKSSVSAYRVLPRPTNVGTLPATPPSPQRVRPMTPYAYGFFGPKETPNWSRSFGHRQSYTQWTLK